MDGEGQGAENVPADLKFIELWFTDVLGSLKSVTIKAADLGSYLETGIGIDGSSIAGFSEVDDSDLVAIPDITTLKTLPWGEVPTGRVFCDIAHPGGEPFPGDTRHVLRRTLERAADLGYSYIARPELEYFYLRSEDSVEPIDRDGYFAVPPGDRAVDLRQATALDLEKLDIDVDFLHHEGGSGQAEIEVKFTDGLKMADDAVTYRNVAKEVARRAGVYVTFMPKPFSDVPGSGMHVHQILLKDNENAFYGPGSEDGLSDVAHRFIAGLLRHAPGITAVTSQWVNSYKRLVPGFEAPVYVCWGRKNRSALVRIPMVRPGGEDRTRIEYRAPDPGCNPYLAVSVMLAAGLEGIREGYDVPDAVEGDIFKLSRRELDDQGIGMLPSSLGEALDRMEESRLVRDCLGDHITDWFLENRRAEWDEYHRHVSDWELNRYLKTL